jgi:hypothetical protein
MLYVRARRRIKSGYDKYGYLIKLTGTRVE